MAVGATILGMADATHYLVGSTDEQGNFTHLPQLDQVAVCNSLNEAKSLLKLYDYHVASFQLQTAYDEMCGMPAGAGYIEQQISL
ncbi:hypothetical protein LP316_12595 [Thalassotalea sp. LPB0316]|uniref:DUF6482 family protein n=1 Tax=Thalassotalea sp. LPB0316 TaxID=2769490 RepID=UPI001867EFA8|nr:DUF6482 family protein [Thalassotalea sp. LPB0316]QOL25133.1 hypothetical protein LP316_12595 [Thalassotalea sp. LPB0316]